MRFCLTVILSFLFVFGNAQKVLVENSNHYFAYELQGDSIVFTFEFLNDTDISLDYNDSTNLDWLILQFDHNQNGIIDQLSKVDLYYMLDTTKQNDICTGLIVNNNSIDPCGSNTTNGRIGYQLASSSQSTSNHLIITFTVPQSEWFTGSHVCTRVSIQGGSSSTSDFHYPSDPGVDYFIQPHYAVQLFPDVELGEDRRVCESDTVYANATYPFYFWSDLEVTNFTTVETSSEVILTVEDNTCSLKDTIEIQILSEAFCEGKIYNFPNVITANSDGFNDVFEPLLSEELFGDPSLYENAELMIFNRWGVKVFGKKGYPSWDGFLDSGNLATEGTYFFILETNNEAGYVLNGYFELFH
jgi:gliding motility-associated-like protein